MLISIGLVFQLATAPYAMMPGVPPVPRDPLTDSLRRAETRFLMTWRREWILAPKKAETDFRTASLHCHFDGSWGMGAPNIIRAANSRRSFCPIWFPADDSLSSDESAGVDASLTEESRTLMRRSRGQLITQFTAAAARQPDNPWISGQLVRLNMDQKDHAAALRAARDCRESKAWCLLLEGFVRHGSGNVAAADSLFVRATRAMSAADRCKWGSISLLLDDRARSAYERIPCASRDSVNATFWWLADPLYIEPGNERRAEHFARQTLIRLHAALTVDERWDWRPRSGGDALASMIVRYGWPSYLYWAGFREDAGHFGEFLHFRDSAVNVATEYSLPRFKTTPVWRAVIDPSTLIAADWSNLSPPHGFGATEWESNWWPREHLPRRSGPLVELPEQTVLFRRDHNALLAIGMDVPLRYLRPGERLPYDAALIAARDPTDRRASARTSVALDGKGTTALTMSIPMHAQVVSAELAPADGAQGIAARARRAVHPPAPLSVLQPGEAAISDPLFFRPGAGDDTPESAEAAIARMYGSLTLPAGRVGIFWESYGVMPSDSVEMTLRLSNEERPGILRRIGTTLGVIGAEGGEISVKWREPRLGGQRGISYAGDVPIQARAVVVDVSRMKKGRYTVEIALARPNGTIVRSRREVYVQH